MLRAVRIGLFIGTIIGMSACATRYDAEGRKIVWPSRKETWITSVMVFIMVLIAALFFWVVDTGLGFAFQRIIALGS